MEHRLEQFSQYLKEANVDAAFINSTENFFYLTGFHTDPHERLLGLLVFPETAPVAVLPGMEKGQIRDAGWTHEVIGYADHEDPWKMIADQMRENGNIEIRTIGIEKQVLSYGRSESFIGLFDNVKVEDIEGQLNEMRVIKDEQEISIMKEAAELADFGVSVGVDALAEGITEMEVLAKIEYELKKKGVSEMSFSTMVLFGGKSGQPHGNPGDRRLKPGDFVLFDLGVVWKGYTSDITRTFAYRSISDEQKVIYNKVKEALEASLAISKPGTRIGDLDQTARDVITDAGYGDKFPHRIGHGLGINVHEFPSMSHLNDGVLKKGMTYTIEPGIYDPEIGGVRLEDDVLVTDDGSITLTKTPKELRIVE
ncbi:Xaa-Pro aminopeptidase. Metallo peptidase. MEROPS family M24B [Halobacillus karajensis]|uniref:M24 family metallopeptidase n=1 Tax=Halobacillus karajensis TaxID=195088 RepID=UPI0008A7478A|nr:Xaa-Pro peptidase family protein [Halobacillus karajensis]SEH48118.1 Xaa-Pro aminopeptidase. Metallo peptidase. MEROPS family M24B [Halobacillus karajensis]